ncbi:MAG TPA: YbfB/YjiJ family MFS transporter, partial [Roseiflexaceae bacterium]|nr:YbfB/YjiJ family MFS transporter [Roseiflexaceae bacterium]
AVSGVIVPWLLGALGWDWRAVWVALGVLGMLTQLVVEPPLRWATRVARTSAASRPPISRPVLGDYLSLWPAMLAYALFGLGYIGYMTFVIAFLRANNVAPVVVQSFWVLLGVCAAVSGFTWRPVVRSLSPRYALCCILLALGVGAALPVMVNALWSFVLSAILFGSSFLAVVTVITVEVRRTLPAERWTTIMGNATALFALGQLLGPTLTGMLADTAGGLVLGLQASALLLGVAGVIALIKPRTRET